MNLPKPGDKLYVTPFFRCWLPDLAVAQPSAYLEKYDTYFPDDRFEVYKRIGKKKPEDRTTRSHLTNDELEYVRSKNCRSTINLTTKL